jgi:hypothetical protein
MMADVEGDLISTPKQPALDDDGMWCWPGPEGTKRKPVEGQFAVSLYTVASSSDSSGVSTNGATTATAWLAMAIAWIAFSL